MRQGKVRGGGTFLERLCIVQQQQPSTVGSGQLAGKLPVALLLQGFIPQMAALARCGRVLWTAPARPFPCECPCTES